MQKLPSIWEWVKIPLQVGRTWLTDMTIQVSNAKSRMCLQTVKWENTMINSEKSLKAEISIITGKSCRIMKMNIRKMMMTISTTKVMMMISLMNSKSSKILTILIWISWQKDKRLLSCRNNNSIWEGNFHIYSSLINMEMFKISPKWVEATSVTSMTIVKDSQLNPSQEEFLKHKFLKLSLMNSKGNSFKPF